MAYKYRLSEKAISEVRKEISSNIDSKTELMKVLNVGERQVANIIASNNINGVLTSWGVVQWILKHTPISTESKILKEEK